MGLRKLFRSYRWKIFFPLLGVMWMVVGALVCVKYYTITNFYASRMQRQMLSAASDILNCYEGGQDPRDYLRFLNQFAAGTVLERMRLSVYEHDKLTYNRGAVIPRKYAETLRSIENDVNGHYIVSLQSNNGEVVVLAALPHYEFGKVDGISTAFWILTGVLLLICLLVSYVVSGYLSHDIKLLRQFALNAASGSADFDRSKFSHDELGDISREIVKLYDDKAKALARTTREHEMAMYAVEEKSRIKRQLTNNINHEIKTPVGVIRGYLDTLASSPDMDAKLKAQFLARAQANVTRLCNLLNDVSTVTRLEEGAQNVPTTQIDFSELVYSVETDLTASGVLENMEFESDIPINCIVKGNTNLLTTVVSNLMRNAVKYSQGTKMTIKLTVESDKFYTFTFYDNGIGVDDKHLPHLFERFYRVDAGRSRKVGGTGLGLPIVRNAIEALGGSISVHNRSTGGLEFVFTLEKWKKA